MVFLAATSACYSYQAVPLTASPKLGDRVVVDLTPQGTAELARYLGPRVTRAEGGLASIAPDSALVIAVDFVLLADGVKQPWSGEGTVAFPRAYLAMIRERRFEKRRSIVASVAATTALIGGAIAALRQAGAGGGGTIEPPPPP